VGNAERGYLAAKLTPRQPWLDVQPRHVPARAYTTSNVDVVVNTRMLPLRRTPRGAIDVDAGPAGKTSVQVKVQVSIARELWRLLKRTVRGAVPEAGRGFRDGFAAGADLGRAAARNAARQPWIVVAAWLILAVAGGLAWWTRTESVLWQEYAIIGLAAPPAVVLVGALVLALLSAIIGLLAGAIIGGTRGLLNVERVELPKGVSASRGLFAVLRWWMGRRKT